ncbi:hypothetical protein BC629DRAFT_221678 [Irpex lacteus]|nr:hypothetical protein BC629DRAFT_221678 [Irpex lacteus]
MTSHPSKLSPSLDGRDADIIIRSSDNVEFRVSKSILRKASPVFAGMFLLPSCDGDEVPSVDLTENKRTVAQLLRLCDPTAADLRIKSVDEARMLLDACQKYEMDACSTKLLRLVTSVQEFRKYRPFEVYILACRAQAVDEARTAAYHCVFQPFPEDSNTPHSRELSTPAHQNLLRYRDTCRQVAVREVSRWNLRWIKPPPIAPSSRCEASAKCIGQRRCEYLEYYDWHGWRGFEWEPLLLTRC